VSKYEVRAVRNKCRNFPETEAETTAAAAAAQDIDTEAPKTPREP